MSDPLLFDPANLKREKVFERVGPTMDTDTEMVYLGPAPDTLELTFVVLGLPKPKGSKKAFVNRKTGHAQIVDDNPTALREWTNLVRDRAMFAMHGDLVSRVKPLVVTVTYVLPRPQGHFGTGRNAETLRKSAPECCIVKPDTDKLDRAILDALTGIVYHDDAQVCGLHAVKALADPGEMTGAIIAVSEAQAHEDARERLRMGDVL